MNENPLTLELRRKVLALMQDNDAPFQLVIGWSRGIDPQKAVPLFATSEADAGRLIFDGTCHQNLTGYLTRDRGRIFDRYDCVGIVVKGCDARSLNLLISENQVKRERVFIIGLPCDGVTDPNHSIQRGESSLSRCCLTCRYPDALNTDVFIGIPRDVILPPCGFDPEIALMMSLTHEERRVRMKNTYRDCLRCYACRNVCPSCYCGECVVDWNDPQWFGKTTGFSDTLMFHLVRDLHLAGRCVACGACERACPMGIPVALPNQRLAMELAEKYEYIAGLTPDQKGAMSVYEESDNNDFFIG